MTVRRKTVADRPKCKIGIEELDLQMYGGMPAGHTFLVTGSAGTGKTTLCMEFLFNGAKMGENGVYFTTVESLPKIKKHMRNYEFFDEKLIDDGKLSIIDMWTISDRLGLDKESYTIEDAHLLFDVLVEIAKELDAKRLVIDSVTALCYRLQSRETIRDFIFKLGTSLAAVQCTTALTSEIAPRTFTYSRYDIEEFIADGIIFLNDSERRGDLLRTLQIIKMRGIPHSRTKFAMHLSSKEGIKLSPLLKSES
jgi:circadian clock protein KaiC